MDDAVRRKRRRAERERRGLDQAALGTYVMFTTRPTDRALDGWCGLPSAAQWTEETFAAAVTHWDDEYPAGVP